MVIDEQKNLLTNRLQKQQPPTEGATKITQPKRKQMTVIPTSDPRVKIDKKSDEEVMPLGKMNFILLAVSLVLVVVGFVMMSGSSNTGTEFNNSIFDSSRIVVAPLLVFLGFLLVAVSILVRGPQKKNNLDAE